MIGMSPDWITEETSKRLWDAQASAKRKLLHDARQSAIAALGSDSLLSQSEKLVKGYILNSARYWYNPEFDCSPFWKDVKVNVPLFNEYVSSSAAFYHVDRNPTVEVPIFVAVGQHDYVAVHTQWKLPYESLPNLRFVL